LQGLSRFGENRKLVISTGREQSHQSFTRD